MPPFVPQLNSMESNIKYTTHRKPFGVDPSHYRRQKVAKTLKEISPEKYTKIRNPKPKRKKTLQSQKYSPESRIIGCSMGPIEPKIRKVSVAPWGRPKLRSRDKYLIPRPQPDAIANGR